MQIKSKRMDKMTRTHKRILAVILFIACVVLFYLAMEYSNHRAVWKGPL
jgi:hypothetical protein